MKNPCIGCQREERNEIGHHSKCEEYMEFFNYNREAGKKAIRDQEAQDYHIWSVIMRAQKMRKK